MIEVYLWVRSGPCCFFLEKAGVADSMQLAPHSTGSTTQHRRVCTERNRLRCLAGMKAEFRQIGGVKTTAFVRVYFPVNVPKSRYSLVTPRKRPCEYNLWVRCHDANKMCEAGRWRSPNERVTSLRMVSSASPPVTIYIYRTRVVVVVVHKKLRQSLT